MVARDETGEIADEFASTFANLEHVRVPTGEPKGKARVLNYGLSRVDTEFVAVYDADNQPEPQALLLLVGAALTTPGAVGAVGYVKTINGTKNWLTRMIALEFSVFQLLMQSGRWNLFRLGSLTGTNMIVSTEALNQVGGWDALALAEDADLTMRLTAAGGLLPVVPESRTWEQEPEQLWSWMRQRTRWMQGNLYLIGKMFRADGWLKGRVAIHSIQLLSVYLLFVFFLLVSDSWFVLGLLGLARVTYPIPLLLLWFESLLVYVVQILSAETVDAPLDPTNLFLAFLMYFTYAQLWIVLLMRGWIRQARLRKSRSTPVWDKTIRF